MVTTLQIAYLSSNLSSPVIYQAGGEIECTISFIAPEAGKYYLIGALYTTGLEYISGTLFGILLPEGSDYAVKSSGNASLWELNAEEAKDLPCKFTFDRSDVVLGLFLMKMAGDEPSFDNDEQIASLSVQLTSPSPPITMAQLFSMAMMVGMFGFVMYEALKD